jgi:uncharacterized phage protein (TIGR02220 family)
MPAGRILLKSISDSKKLSELKTDGARLLYTWLIPHLDVNGCFSGDAEVLNGKVFTRLKKTVNTVESYLADMESVGLIVRYQTNGDIFLHVPDFTKKQPYLNPKREAQTTIPVPTHDQLMSNSGVTPTQCESKRESKRESKDILSGKPDVVSEIISFLNQTAGRNFSSKAKETVSLITARLKEGRTVDDFRRVITTKVAKWKDDPKMGDYLRPETLFTAKHFESYLNEPSPVEIKSIGEPPIPGMVYDKEKDAWVHPH